MRDRYGNQISTASEPARERYCEGVDCFLAAQFGAQEAFGAAIEADPGFALGHVALARAEMMAGDMPAARAAIARAVALADGLPRREAQHVAAFDLLLAGKAAEARAVVREHAEEFPRDAMVVQMCTSVFGLIGFSGQAGREADLLAFTAALMPHYGDDWWMMSQHAISLCETGQTAAAMALMDRALEREPRNANGAHFKAHAHYERGETAEGRDFLQGWMADYDKRSVLHGHMSWHVALWSLHVGDIQAMWDMVDAAVVPGQTASLPINVLTDTASILYRAQLAGVPVAPERWQALSDYAIRFFPDTGTSFADMHGALAHAMAGRGDALERMISDARGPAGDIVAPLAAGWRAIAAQDWAGALAALTPVMAQHERLGGSRAQRDLLEFAYLNVLLKLGRQDEARRLLALRRPALAGAVPVVAL